MHPRNDPFCTPGPTSICGEEVAPGILSAKAILLPPPAPISLTEILSEVLPEAWKNGKTTAQSLATALSQKHGRTLPWKTVATVIDQALNNRYLKLAEDSGGWPCDFSGAGKVILVETEEDVDEGGGAGEEKSGRIATISISCEEAQDILDALANEAVPALLDVKARTGVGVRISVSIEHDPSTANLSEESAEAIEKAAESVSSEFRLVRKK